MNLYLSTRNIPNVDVITVREINPVNLLKANKVAVTADAFQANRGVDRCITKNYLHL